jgi:hypothetical protein
MSKKSRISSLWRRKTLEFSLSCSALSPRSASSFRDFFYLSVRDRKQQVPPSVTYSLLLRTSTVHDNCYLPVVDGSSGKYLHA